MAARTKTRTRTKDKSIKEYARKRDFRRTPEPKAAVGAAGGGGFVVQKHDARRLHYDLRLELDGVLKSWAVTRGPSLTVTEKRLAVRTEDHPMKYLDFEGNIPKGEYGGGSMIVWDRGTWAPEGDPHKGMTKGHLAFSLDGDRLKGKWHLVRLKPRSGERSENWLLMKSDDEYARHVGDPEITAEEDTSKLSGRTNAELAAEGDVRVDHKERAKIAKARKAPLPDVAKVKGARKGLLPVFLEPCLASPTDTPPSGGKWIHEIKHDGYRIQARVDGKSVRLLTRKGLDWTEKFASVSSAVKELGLSSGLIDGEIVVEDTGGLTSLNDLQADLKAGRQDRFRYFAFDLLYCEGFDLTKVPLLERKALLEKILAPAPERIRYSEHIETHGPTMLEHSCRLGLEGIISKRADLPHRSGRGDQWLKSKCRQSQEFIIVGYVPSTAAPRAIGALALGYYEGKTLRYAGRVGTGWSWNQASALFAALDKLKGDKPVFVKGLPNEAVKGVVWTAPKLVGEIEFRDWTDDEMVRQASFKGLRDDKSPEEIVLEARSKRVKVAAPPRAAAKVKLTHPERILWPEPGVTKQGLADFYTDIADWILPHIKDRVLSLLRAPSGVTEKGFFAKHPWAGVGEVVTKVDVGAEEPMMAIDDLAGLLTLVQAGVVEIHPWGSHIKDIEKPDQLIFDLDPSEQISWNGVIDAARDVRARLEKLGLESFVKTTGGKGLHVVVPITPSVGWKDAKTFTQGVAETMARERPDRYIATMSKRARRGLIFVDYLRNDRGSTAVAAYSTRAKPRASVSTPLSWDELSNDIRANHFTVDNLRHRLDYLKDDPWAGFFKVKQRIPKA